MGEVVADQFQRLMKINLEGVFLSCQAEGRTMLKHGRGSIINIASMSGSIVNRGLLQAHYNSSKAAVMHLSKSLAMEWSDRGVRVNAISAGPIRTLAASGISGFKDIFNHIAEHAPLRRNVTIDDVGNVALFLASDLSGAMTGETIFVDSGYNIMGI